MSDVMYPNGWLSVDLLDTAAINMAATAATYKWTVPTTAKNARVLSLSMYVEDGTACLDSVFGGLAAALTNGVLVRAGAIVMQTWKTNREVWQASTDVLDSAARQGITAGFAYEARIVFPEKGLQLLGGQTFEVETQDDLSLLVFMAGRISVVLNI